MMTDPPDQDQVARNGAAPPPPAAAPGPPALTTPRHQAAADALQRALDEGYVYAALTGPRGTGKSTVLAAVLATVRGLRVLRVAAPDKVTAALGAEIERVALDEAAKPETDRHVAIVVDDAHLASADLLDSLARLAAARRVGGRLPQVLLVGQPVLWDRLRAERFRPLERRLAIRHELLPATTEDPWASIEQALTPVMAAASLTPPAPPLAPPASASPPPGVTPPALARAGVTQAAEPAAAASAVTYPSGARTLSQTDEMLARQADAAARPPSRWPLVAVALALLVIGGVTVSTVLTSIPKNSPPAAIAPAPPPALAEAHPAPEPPPAAQLPAPPPAPPAPGPAPADTAAPEPAHAEPAHAEPAPATEPAAVAPAAVMPAAQVPVVPSLPAPAAEPPPAPPAAASAAAPPTLAPEIAALMLRRGEDRLALGDIAAARAFFERAGTGGNARAALLAARTYDPAMPGAAAGLADYARAAEWYRRAAALGDKDAIIHLRQPGEPSR